MFHILEESTFAHAEDLAAAYDEVIQYPDVDELQRIDHPPRNELVGLQGLTDARWMWMRQNDGRRIAPQRFPDDLPRMHRGPIDSAAEELDELYNPTPDCPGI